MDLGVPLFRERPRDENTWKNAPGIVFRCVLERTAAQKRGEKMREKYSGVYAVAACLRRPSTPTVGGHVTQAVPFDFTWYDCWSSAHTCPTTCSPPNAEGGAAHHRILIP